MNSTNQSSKICISAMLCALGIVIPILAPKITIEPASFTLASHVVLFLAMFLSTKISIIVSLGTTLGFILTGRPLIVVIRAFSHIIFVLLGAIWLRKKPNILTSTQKYICFSFVVGLVHAFMEIIAVLPFYWSGNFLSPNYEKDFLVSIVILVGVGTLIHSMVDAFLAKVVYQLIIKNINREKCI